MGQADISAYTLTKPFCQFLFYSVSHKMGISPPFFSFQSHLILKFLEMIARLPDENMLSKIIFLFLY